jgi:hypothetical protein
MSFSAFGRTEWGWGGSPRLERFNGIASREIQGMPVPDAHDRPDDGRDGAAGGVAAPWLRL